MISVDNFRHVGIIIIVIIVRLDDSMCSAMLVYSRAIDNVIVNLLRRSMNVVGSTIKFK